MLLEPSALFCNRLLHFVALSFIEFEILYLSLKQLVLDFLGFEFLMGGVHLGRRVVHCFSDFVELLHVVLELILQIIAVVDMSLVLCLTNIDFFLENARLLINNFAEVLLVVLQRGLMGFHSLFVLGLMRFVLIDFVSDEFANAHIFFVLQLAIGALRVDLISDQLHLRLEFLGKLQTLLSVLLQQLFVFQV